MEIIELGEGQMGEWRSFLAEQPHLIFHTPEYQQFLRAAFPSTEFKCVAAVENGIQLILPIGLIRSPGARLANVTSPARAGEP